MKQHPKPNRYIVLHSHSWSGYREEAWASYNTALDKLTHLPNALSQATMTAKRYGGEIHAAYDNGDNYLVKSYRK